MNRTKTIALFAGIFAIAMTTIGLSDTTSASMMTAPLPQTQDGVTILGHVEYRVFDNDQQVKAYFQGDNLIVDDGTDCAANLLFGSTTTGTNDCDLNTSAFTYIAIGNVTGTPLVGDEDIGGVCALNTAGELAREIVIPNITVQGAGSGTQIELEPATTFKFDAGNATTIRQSAIFNAAQLTEDVTEPGGGMCATYNADGQEDMFAKQNLPSPVTVNSGDSLAVKWTITIQ